MTVTASDKSNAAISGLLNEGDSILLTPEEAEGGSAAADSTDGTAAASGTGGADAADDDGLGYPDASGDAAESES